MKNYLLAIIILAFGLNFRSYGQDSLQLQTPKQLGELTFRAFKSNDFDLFETLLITEAKHNFILESLNISDSLKEVFIKQGEGGIKHLRGQAKENFNEVLKTAKQFNLNWNKAKLIQVLNTPRDKNGITRSDIGIKIESEGVYYRISLRNCTKSDTWCIMNKVRLTKV
jgi:hypothetical protein